MPQGNQSLIGAAELLLQTRQDILSGSLGTHLSRVSAARQNIDAGVTRTGNILVITGSDGIKDYAFYNLRPWRPLPKMIEIDQITATDLPAKAFHKGFLLHAARIKRFLGDHQPDFIIGHSLGAAAAQILGTSFAVPTICLASPQVVRRKYLAPDPLRRADHRQWNVFNMAWHKDLVARGYRAFGFRALGHRVVVDSRNPNFGIDHFVEDYQELMVKAAAQNVVGLPQQWPDPNFALPSRLA